MHRKKNRKTEPKIQKGKKEKGKINTKLRMQLPWEGETEDS